MKIIINGVKIKTNKYAGNFEREMTAFCTGHIGDCEVGDKEQMQYLQEYSNELKGIENIPDEYGCNRPVVLDKNSNNLIVVFEDSYKINKDVVDFIKMRAENYGNSHNIEIIGLECGEFII